METREFLKTLGYQEPYDDSPVEVPEGWDGGSVGHTGGNIFCRRWETWKDDEDGESVGYEVIYDVTRSSTVACEKFLYNEDVGYPEHQSTEMLKDAEYRSDYALAQVAKSIMEIMNTTVLSDSAEEASGSNSNEEPVVLRSQGHVMFDDLAEDSFRDLVAETLNTSEFIETTTDPESGLLVINEVGNSER